MTELLESPWNIEEGIRNAERFFRVLPRVFPVATLFVAEGSGITKEVAALYRRHAPSKVKRPADLSRFTLVPRYFCTCSPEFFLELARVASTTPRAGLLHHLYVYRGEDQLIDWHDAFANALLISPDLLEETVATLARKFDRRYRRARFPSS